MVVNQNKSDLTLDALLSPSEFAQLLGIGRRTFQSWRAAGKLPTPDLHEGKIIRWRRTTIQSWLDDRSKHQGRD